MNSKRLLSLTSSFYTYNFRKLQYSHYRCYSKNNRSKMTVVSRNKDVTDKVGLGQMSKFKFPRVFSDSDTQINDHDRRRNKSVPRITAPTKPWYQIPKNIDGTQDYVDKNQEDPKEIMKGHTIPAARKRNTQVKARRRNVIKETKDQPRSMSKRKMKNLNTFDMSEEELSEYFSRSSAPRIRGTCVFGLYPVLLALQQGRRKPFNKFYMKDDLIDSDKKIIKLLKEAAALRKMMVVPTSNKVLDVLANFRPHQGVCLDCEVLHFEPLDLEQLRERKSTEHQVWLLLNDVKDTMNVGGIIRTAYYLGIDKILSSAAGCKPTSATSKSSAGTLELTPIYGVQNVQDFLKEARDANWEVIGTSPPNPAECPTVSEQQYLPLNEFKLSKNAVIIIGNEAEGLSEDVQKTCSTILSVSPGRELNPLVDSLNVSVVTGIILHAIIKSKVT